MKKSFPFWILPCVLFTFSFYFCYIANAALSADQFVTRGSDLVSRFFGSAKEGIGDISFLKADEYFHGGVEEHFEHTAETFRAEGVIHDHEHEQRHSAGDWITKLNNQIKVNEHYHLTAEQRKEMLPFLAWATSLNPNNIEAVLTTAYWLSDNFGKVDEAIALLEKARRANPDSWEIAKALGEIYYKDKKDYSKSIPLFTEALKHLDANATFHEAGILAYYLAVSYEMSGDLQEAKAAYRQSLRLFAGHEEPGIREKILSKIK